MLLCTTILPSGKYCYLRLPMRVSPPPDIFPEIISDLFSDFIFVIILYINDILIITHSDEDIHLTWNVSHRFLRFLWNMGSRSILSSVHSLLEVQNYLVLLLSVCAVIVIFLIIESLFSSFSFFCLSSTQKIIFEFQVS